MKLSDDSDYIEYGVSVSKGDLTSALKSLNKVKDKCWQTGDTALTAFLIRKVGELYYRLGDKRAGQAKLEKSLELSPSMLNYYHAVEFLIDLRLPESKKLALKLCQNAMHLDQDGKLVAGEAHKFYSRKISALFDHLMNE